MQCMYCFNGIRDTFYIFVETLIEYVVSDVKDHAGYTPLGDAMQEGQLSYVKVIQTGVLSKSGSVIVFYAGSNIYKVSSFQAAWKKCQIVIVLFCINSLGFF